MFKKISHIVFSIITALMLLAVTAPIPAQAQSPALTSMATSYSGNYRIGMRRGTVSFTVARRIMGGWEGTAVLNGIQYYSNVVPQTNGTTIVSIFSLDASYNQVIVATITGTFSADYVTFSGPIVMKGKTGQATLKAK